MRPNQTLSVTAAHLWNGHSVTVTVMVDEVVAGHGSLWCGSSICAASTPGKCLAGISGLSVWEMCPSPNMENEWFKKSCQ